MNLLHELFAIRVTADYNIHHNLSRFVLLLPNIRKDVAGCRQTTFIAGNR
jgi:hypothetical protein